MAEISLKEYLARVDNLLKERASDEVIHHSRHILQYYPKNVAAYRFLGVALADRSRWGDVAEVFRRVLSVYPDDDTAHLGLSEAYEHSGKQDDAIWHLERAFEQNPNNDDIINKLRSLYLQSRNVEYTKMQLTAGAVARQYARNSLYDQAIDTLQQALERTPDRIDLRVLMAQMLWESGYRVDAAETALEVLHTLPDCLQANRILTELWLSEGRPSDAQRYLSRIEALDPYLALELAHGQPPPDDVLRLQELDYERAAKRELATASPDWLGELGGDSSDWMAAFKEAPPQIASETPMSDLMETALPDDWLTDTGSLIEQPPSSSNIPPPRKRTGVTGLLSSLDTPEEAPLADELPSFDDELPGEAIPFPAEETGEDLLAELPASVAIDEDSVPDFFEELASAPPAPPSTPGDADPLAWLHQSGIELVETEEAGPPDLFGDDEEFILQEQDQANPLAWLEGSGMEIERAESSLETPTETSADPLAWLHQSGGETVDEVPQAAAPLSQPDAQDEALLDWLADESVLDEMLDMEALSTGPLKPLDEAQEVEMPDENWLNEQPPDEQTTGDAAQPADTPDWLAAMAPAEEEAQPVEDAGLEWMSEATAEPAESPDWLAAAAPVEPSTIEPAADASFEWMAEVEPEPAQPADAPDWLAAMAPAEEEAQPVEDAGLEWMSEATAEPAESPDWLAAAAPAEPSTSSDETSFEWGSEPEIQAAASADTNFEWMAEVEPEPAQPADTPDWLAAMAPAEEEDQPVEDAGLEWMNEATAEPAESPDWLAAAAPVEPPTSEPAPSTETSFEWMAEVEPEPAQPADTPDWLAAMAPAENEAQPVEDASLEWMSEAEAEPAESPDWLAAAAPVEPPTSEPAPSTETSFEWMAEVEPEPAQPADAPDWLSELVPSPEEPEEEAEAVPADSPDWLSEMDPSSEEPEEEAEAVPADSPDWLAELAPAGAGDETPLDEEPEAEPGETPDWLAAMAPAKETAVSAADFGFDAKPANEQPATSEFSWLNEMNKSEESELADADFVDSEEMTAAPVPAENAPDWLNAMVPGLDVDYDAPEDEPIESEYIEGEARRTEIAAASSTPPVREFEWLNEIVSEEALEPAAQSSRRRFVFSRQPAWLRRPVERQDAAPVASKSANDGDMPGWLQDDDDDKDFDLPPWLQ